VDRKNTKVSRKKRAQVVGLGEEGQARMSSRAGRSEEKESGAGRGSARRQKRRKAAPKGWSRGAASKKRTAFRRRQEARNRRNHFRM
jgi:hypothetical protein